MITGSLQKKKRKKGDTYYAVIHLGSKDYKWINLDMIANRSTKPLGHSNISTTMNIYTHIDISRKRDMSKGLEGLLFQ